MIDFEDVELQYPPEKYDAFIAMVSDKLNRNRTRMYFKTKEKGYYLTSYISS